ncbi:DUF21 domain-containing protein At1g55930, chloroplastic-like isoform X6, partial [Fagus crenata]
MEGVVNAGYGVIGQSILFIGNAWPRDILSSSGFKTRDLFLQRFWVSQDFFPWQNFNHHTLALEVSIYSLTKVINLLCSLVSPLLKGLILAALLGLSAFFSMAETSITTLWPWKVLELAEKDSENGVFKTLRSDVTRFLTTILIGTTVVNIGATALVTEAATAIFGEAGVSAATGVMTVAILLLTEITPKSIAVHNATEVARFVMSLLRYIVLLAMLLGQTSGVAFLGIISCGKSCYIFIYGDAKNPWFKRNK